MQVIDQSSIEREIDRLARDSGADRFGTLPVVHRPNLFTPKRELRRAGLTIAQIIESIDTLPASFWERGVVTIDRRDGRGAQEVPREKWRYIKPKADSVIPIEVNLWLPPQDGGIRQILSLVAAVAVLAATIFLAPVIAPTIGALFSLSATTALGVAQVGIALAGALAISALTPPPSVPALTAGGGLDAGQGRTPASLSGNVLRPGAPIPHVRGRRKLFPPMVVKPLVELVGDDEYVTAVFGLSGRHDFENIRADGFPLEDMEEVEYETRDGATGNSVLTLITRQSKTDSSVITLSQHEVDVSDTDALEDQTTPENSVPYWHGMRADGSPDEIWINLHWPTGLFDGDDPSLQMVTPVRVRMRQVGATDWIRLPEILFAYRKQEPFQKDIRIKWESAPALPTPKVDRAPYAAYSAVPMRFSDASNTELGDFNIGGLGDVNDGVISVSGIQKTGSTASMYAGANFGSTRKRKAIKALVWGHPTNGFADSASVTVQWWGKESGSPANATDGTLLATSGSMADTTAMVELNSGDTTTEWQSQWIRVVGSTNTQYYASEIMLLDDGDWSWIAHSHFYSGLNTSRLMRDSTIATTQVRNIALYEDRADVFLNAATIPQGDYEIEIMRGGVVNQGAFDEAAYEVTGEGDSRVSDLFKWNYDDVVDNEYELARGLGNVQYQMQRRRFSLIWNEHPLPDAPGNLALIAVKIRNRSINQLAVDAARYVLDWDGAGWNTESTTANPATHVRDILAGGLNADPVPSDLIDNDSLVTWRNRCASEGREVNAVIEGISADVAAQLCAGCGFARMRQSETFGVIEDKDRSAESPVQTFTSRNSRSYQFEKSFVRRPSGFRCIYADRDDDYQETELIVDDPNNAEGTGASARYEEVRFDGFVTSAEVIERANFDLDQSRLRMAFHSFEANGQAIKCQRGDLIGLNHPILEAQMGAAYVQEVLTAGSDVIGLTLDGTVPTLGADGFFSGPDDFIADLYGDGLWQGTNAGAVIRLHNGEGEITAEINASDGIESESREIMFTTPIAGPVEGLDRDCLVTVGRLGEERLRLILVEIQPKPGPSYPARLVAVDEAPELWAT